MKLFYKILASYLVIISLLTIAILVVGVTAYVQTISYNDEADKVDDQKNITAEIQILVLEEQDLINDNVLDTETDRVGFSSLYNDTDELLEKLSSMDLSSDELEVLDEVIDAHDELHTLVFDPDTGLFHQIDVYFVSYEERTNTLARSLDDSLTDLLTKLDQIRSTEGTLDVNASVNELEAHVLNMQYNLLKYLHDDFYEKADYVIAKDTFYAENSSATTIMDRLSLVVSPASSDTLDETSKSLVDIVSISEDLFDILDGKLEIEDAIEEQHEEIADLGEDMDEGLSEMIQDMDKRSVGSLKSAFITASILSIISIAVVIIFTFVLGWKTSSHITKPLRDIQETAEAISKGDVDARLRMRDRKDEISDLAMAFDRMSETLPPAQYFKINQASNLPEVDEIFITTKAGLLVKHFTNEAASELDEDILSGMITVVQLFIADTFSKKKTTLKEMRLGDFNILITPGRELTAVVISPADDLKPLEKPVNIMIKDIEKINAEPLKEWDGNLNSITGIEECITRMVNAEY